MKQEMGLDLDVQLVTEFGGIMEYYHINIIRMTELSRWKDHILSAYKEQVVSVGGSLYRTIGIMVHQDLQL